MNLGRSLLVSLCFFSILSFGGVKGVKADEVGITADSQIKVENVSKKEVSKLENDQLKDLRVQHFYQTKFGFSKIDSSPVVFENKLYFGCNDGYLYVIDSESGEFIWRFNAEYEIKCKPVIEDGIVMFSSNEVFYGLDVNTGELKWKYDTGYDKETRKRVDYWDYFDSSAIIHKNIAYWGTANGSVIGIDIRDGEVKWEFKTKEGSHIRTTPIIKNGVIYFGDFQSNLYAVDLKTKKLKWISKVGIAGIQSNLLMYKNTIYFGSRDAKVFAVDSKNGEIKWSFFDRIASWVCGEAIEVNGDIYIGSSDSYYLYCFDSDTGEVKWKYKTEQNIFGKPIVYENYLCFGNGDSYAILGYGVFYIVDLNTHETVFKQKVYGNIFATPVIKDDVIYFTTEWGIVYKIDLKK